jgi:hypothetical protein
MLFGESPKNLMVMPLNKALYILKHDALREKRCQTGIEPDDNMMPVWIILLTYNQPVFT